MEEDDPEFVGASPPCTPLSLLQELNFPKMPVQKVVNMILDGLHHIETAVEV